LGRWRLFYEDFSDNQGIIRRDAIIEEWKNATIDLVDPWITTRPIANKYEDKLGLPRDGWLTKELGTLDVTIAQSNLIGVPNRRFDNLVGDDDPPTAGRGRKPKQSRKPGDSAWKITRDVEIYVAFKLGRGTIGQSSKRALATEFFPDRDDPRKQIRTIIKNVQRYLSAVPRKSAK
jgi:hypothetical protein